MYTNEPNHPVWKYILGFSIHHFQEKHCEKSIIQNTHTSYIIVIIQDFIDPSHHFRSSSEKTTQEQEIDFSFIKNNKIYNIIWK